MFPNFERELDEKWVLSKKDHLCQSISPNDLRKIELWPAWTKRPKTKRKDEDA